MRKKSDIIALEEAQLNILINSFYYTQLKDSRNPLIADKKKLIFKMVDKFKITEIIAKKYLNILESRNLIAIDKNAIYYCQKKFNARRIEEERKSIAIDKFFEGVKK